MRVGVLPTFDRQWGGVYQYCQMVLTALAELREQLDPVLVYSESDRDHARALEVTGWTTLSFAPPTSRGAARRFVARAFGETVASGIGGFLRRERASASKGGAAITDHTAPRRWLQRNGVDLMLYPAPMTLSFELGLPYVMAVHDLQHRLHPEFAEVSANGELEQREHLYRNGIGGAEAILVDSEIGRDDVIQLYGHLTSPDRVWVLPYILPPALSNVIARPAATANGVADDERFLLFPAQFWPHKNHVRLTEAVVELHRSGLDVTVVMTGSTDFEQRQPVLLQVRELARRAGIEDLIRIVGYVDDEAIARLYRGATAVVLPTFFGPTNIPVIEAWAVGAPVLTSDIRGIREQCGDAALLVDPTSVSEIAEGLRRLWTDRELRSRLAAAGRRRLDASDPSTFRDRLGEALLHAGCSSGRPLARTPA